MGDARSLSETSLARRALSHCGPASETEAVPPIPACPTPGSRIPTPGSLRARRHLSLRSIRCPSIRRCFLARCPERRGIRLCAAKDAGDQIEAAVRYTLGHQGVSRLSFVPHSWGSIPVGRFAGRHPAAVDRWVLFGPIARRAPRRYEVAPTGPAWRVRGCALAIRRLQSLSDQARHQDRPRHASHAPRDHAHRSVSRDECLSAGRGPIGGAVNCPNA